MSLQSELTALLGRISTPAKEIRDMLVVKGAYDDTGRAALGAEGDVHAAALRAYMEAVLQIGDVYWVSGLDGVGSNSNSGLTPAAPLLTIKYALSLCTDNNNDVIVVKDYWQPTGEDWPIVVNKQQVHIVGLAQSNLPFPAVSPDSDVAAFQLASSGQYGSIENLTIGGGAAHGCIEWGGAGQVDGFLIKECTFGHPWFRAPLNAIRQTTTFSRGGYGNKIEKCTFLGDLCDHKGAITGNAIAQLVTSGTARAFYDLEIVGNVFKGCQRAINLLLSFDAVITGNIFTVPDVSAHGESIWLDSDCTGNIINNNHSFKGNAAPLTYNPYYDAGDNHWGLNYQAGVGVMPAS